MLSASMETSYFVLPSAQRKEISDTVFHQVSNTTDAKFLYCLAHSILYCLARSEKDHVVFVRTLCAQAKKNKQPYEDLIVAFCSA